MEEEEEDEGVLLTACLDTVRPLYRVVVRRQPCPFCTAMHTEVEVKDCTGREERIPCLIKEEEEEEEEEEEGVP